MKKNIVKKSILLSIALILAIQPAFVAAAKTSTNNPQTDNTQNVFSRVYTAIAQFFFPKQKPVVRPLSSVKQQPSVVKNVIKKAINNPIPTVIGAASILGIGALLYNYLKKFWTKEPQEKLDKEKIEKEKLKIEEIDTNIINLTNKNSEIPEGKSIPSVPSNNNIEKSESFLNLLDSKNQKNEEKEKLEKEKQEQEFIEQTNKETINDEEKLKQERLEREKQWLKEEEKNKKRKELREEKKKEEERIRQEQEKKRVEEENKKKQEEQKLKEEQERKIEQEKLEKQKIEQEKLEQIKIKEEQDELNKKLGDAVDADNTSGIKSLIDRGANPNTPVNKDGSEMPLVYFGSKISTAYCLIKYGAEVPAKNEKIELDADFDLLRDFTQEFNDNGVLEKFVPKWLCIDNEEDRLANWEQILTLLVWQDTNAVDAFFDELAKQQLAENMLQGNHKKWLYIKLLQKCLEDCPDDAQIKYWTNACEDCAKEQDSDQEDFSQMLSTLTNKEYLFEANDVPEVLSAQEENLNVLTSIISKYINEIKKELQGLPNLYKTNKKAEFESLQNIFVNFTKILAELNKAETIDINFENLKTKLSPLAGSMLNASMSQSKISNSIFRTSTIGKRINKPNYKPDLKCSVFMKPNKGSVSSPVQKIGQKIHFWLISRLAKIYTPAQNPALEESIVKINSEFEKAKKNLKKVVQNQKQEFEDPLLTHAEKVSNNILKFDLDDEDEEDEDFDTLKLSELQVVPDSKKITPPVLPQTNNTTTTTVKENVLKNKTIVTNNTSGQNLTVNKVKPALAERIKAFYSKEPVINTSKIVSKNQGPLNNQAKDSKLKEQPFSNPTVDIKNLEEDSQKYIKNNQQLIVLQDSQHLGDQGNKDTGFMKLNLETGKEVPAGEALLIGIAKLGGLFNRDDEDENSDSDDDSDDDLSQAKTIDLERSIKIGSDDKKKSNKNQPEKKSIGRVKIHNDLQKFFGVDAKNVNGLFKLKKNNPHK